MSHHKCLSRFDGQYSGPTVTHHLQRFRPDCRHVQTWVLSRSTHFYHYRALMGQAAAAEQGVHGKAITPFLLDRLRAETHGDSLRANIVLVTRNAALAGEIAVAAAAA